MRYCNNVFEPYSLNLIFLLPITIYIPILNSQYSIIYNIFTPPIIEQFFYFFIF